MPRVLVGLLLLSSTVPASAETVRIHVRERLTGAPIRGAIINLLEETPLVRTVVTDANGDANVDVASADKLWFAIRSPRHGQRCFAAADTSNGRLTADLDKSIRLQGTVSDAQGRPVADALVGLSYELDPACRVHIAPLPTMTGKDGRYVLRNVDVSRPLAIAVRRRGHETVIVEHAHVLAVLEAAGPVSAVNDPRREVNVTLPPPK